MADYILHNGELYHYGVPGMKWGIRRATKNVEKSVGRIKKGINKISTQIEADKKYGKAYDEAMDAYDKADANSTTHKEYMAATRIANIKNAKAKQLYKSTSYYKGISLVKKITKNSPVGVINRTLNKKLTPFNTSARVTTSKNAPLNLGKRVVDSAFKRKK